MLTAADDLLDGTVHIVPDDLRAALAADLAAVALWQSLTPLGRNEFLCWVEDAKQPATRARRIVRTVEELHEGKRRPCCWPGCVHRTDKVPGKWQQAVLVEGRRR
jgi:Bacteriocin-protection, YdeI or OmpD-Associated